MQTIIRTTSDNQDFKNLILKLDELLQITDGAEHSFFAQFNKVENIKNVVVCYKNEKAIGCGAFKVTDNQTVEIKRMFVDPNFRGKGVASLVLKELELWAKEEHYSIIILETGRKLENAISLYKKSGYAITKNYEQYIGVESSVCFRKDI